MFKIEKNLLEIFLSSAAFSDLSIKNAHCWHTEEVFSKFQFGAGKYDNKDFSNMSNMTTTRDYITAVAISSMRLTNEELIKLSKNNSLAVEAKNWQRLSPMKKD